MSSSAFLSLLLAMPAAIKKTMTDDGIGARRQVKLEPFTACCVDTALIPSQTLSAYITSREPAVVVDPTRGI